MGRRRRARRRCGGQPALSLGRAAGAACEALEGRLLLTGDRLGTATDVNWSPSQTYEMDDQIPNNPLGNRDVDLWQFNLRSGDTLSAQVTNTGGNLNTVLRLFNENGIPLDSNNNPNNNNAALTFTNASNATRTYYVGVSGAGNGGYDPAAPTAAFSASTSSHTPLTRRAQRPGTTS
jgi:hypothetical protein